MKADWNTGKCPVGQPENTSVQTPKESTEREKETVRVILVDDDKIQRMIIRNIIGKIAEYDIIVDEAENGLEGLEMIEAGKYDVAFVDYMMPKMNGIECISGIRTEHRPNIVMVTSMEKNQIGDGWNLVEQAYKLGVYNYAQKPVIRSELFFIARNAMTDSVNRRKVRQYVQVVEQNRQRIANVLADIISQEQEYIESINHRHFPGLEIAVFQKAYDGGCGDVFIHNRFRERHLVGFSMFDVSGHSLETSVIAGRVRRVRMEEISHPVRAKPYSPVQVLERMNHRLRSILPVGKFSTAIDVQFDLENMTLDIANAGSEAPMLIRKSGDTVHFPSVHLPLGIVDEFPTPENPFVNRIPVSRGDVFVSCSDGLLESIDENGMPFRDRLPEIVQHTRHYDPKALLSSILQAYRQHMGITGELAFDDDVTAFVVKLRDNYHRLDSTFSDLPASLRDFLYGLRLDLHAFGFSPALIQRVNAVMHSAVSNSMRNLRLANADDRITFEYGFFNDNEVLEIIVTDSGNGIDRSMLANETDMDSHIYQMVQSSDSCIFVGKGNRVVMSFEEREADLRYVD